MVEGRITLTDAILVDIAREALKKVEEVYRSEKKGTLAGLGGIFADRFVPQIAVNRISEEEDDDKHRIAFDLKTSMIYGVNIPEVGKKIREVVCKEVEVMTGYTVERVDITVERLIKPEDDKPIEDEEVEE